MQAQFGTTAGRSSTSNASTKTWQDYAKPGEDISNPKVTKQCKDRMRKDQQKIKQKSKKGTRLLIALHNANRCVDAGVSQMIVSVVLAVCDV